MPRMARAVLPGVPHHITQRGVRGSKVFLDRSDFESYRKLLRDSSKESGLSIHAYSLMTNHVHIVAIPERDTSIADTFQRCHGMYASRFNCKYGTSGHTWQARPFSCALDEAHLWTAVRYVERNPVRARMIVRAEDYPWSSARAHCGLAEDDLLDPDWPPADAILDWSAWLANGYNIELEKSIRERTLTGRPCGDTDFVRSAEVALGRQLAPRKRGPKPNRPDSEDGALVWATDENP